MRIMVNESDFPRKTDEPYWIIHPNDRRCKFAPSPGAVTLCTESILSFQKGIAYTVLGADNQQAWVLVLSGADVYYVPQYLFARHFDAEVFITGHADPVELEKAKSFNFKFEDNGR